MKVEIIEKVYYWELQDEINEILSRHKPSDIFDIKYSGNGGHAPYSTNKYSAMIIFTDKE